MRYGPDLLHEMGVKTFQHPCNFGPVVAAIEETAVSLKRQPNG